MKVGSLLAVIVFVVVALAHLFRMIGAVEITVGDTPIPQWLSVFGVLVPALIAYLLWRESRQ